MKDLEDKYKKDVEEIFKQCSIFQPQEITLDFGKIS